MRAIRRPIEEVHKEINYDEAAVSFGVVLL